QLARRLVRARDVVLDVAANVGLWLMGVARAAGAESTVHGFEPLPANFRRLSDNVDRNRLAWVRCHPVAVAAEVGTAVLLPPSGVTRSAASGASCAVRGPSRGAITFSLSHTFAADSCLGQQRGGRLRA